MRDESLPIDRGVTSLDSLIASLHAPFGFLGTVAHLRELVGARRGRRTSRQLAKALDLLEESRVTHLAYRLAFAERPSVEKAEGRRRPTAGDMAALERAEWLKQVEEARTRVPGRRGRASG
ncbi:hypothetical protein [Blastococcus atacamensis]|uniref:hypothetical protein n=1 Tax=Blastococcus atacamensis TaxID=2070508 RepID=UPI0012FFF7A3|nr:hypothetical protein [Blastococcus atacamensis]